MTKSLEVYESTTKFNDALRKNAIYFDNNTYVMLHEYFLIASTMTMELNVYLTKTEESGITLNNIEEKRKNTEKIIFNKLMPIHQKTTDCFRYILGIEKEKQFKEKIV